MSDTLITDFVNMAKHLRGESNIWLAAWWKHDHKFPKLEVFPINNKPT